jgi:myo-inositol catabolism protein IolS
MHTRFSASLDREMPVITFGGASLSGEGGGYGFGAISESESQKLLQAAWEAGITAYDTAPVYGLGLSEERLGRYLPKEAFVISKSGVDWHPSRRINMTNDPIVAERMLHESLRRLKRDRIDLYMIHWPDQQVDIRTTLEVLVRAKEQGKISYLGLCNTTNDDLSKAREITQISALQSELNLFNHNFLTDLGKHWNDVFSMGWGTFDKGILSGRVTHQRKFTKEDCRSWAPWWNKKQVQIKVERTQVLREILKDYDLSLPAFCIHYNLYYCGLSSVLIGMKTVSDVSDVCAPLQVKLLREKMGEILDRWAGTVGE